MLSKLSLPTDRFGNMSVRILSAIINTILTISGLNNKKHIIAHSKESAVGALFTLVNSSTDQDPNIVGLLAFSLRLVSKSQMRAALHFGFIFLSCP